MKTVMCPDKRISGKKRSVDGLMKEKGLVCSWYELLLLIVACTLLGVVIVTPFEENECKGNLIKSNTINQIDIFCNQQQQKVITCWESCEINKLHENCMKKCSNTSEIKTCRMYWNEIKYVKSAGVEGNK